MLVVVLRRITALAAAAMVGVTAPAAARVEPGGFDATLRATLERSWSWRGTPGCEPGSGAGRRVLTIRTARPARLAPTGGRIPVVGAILLSGRATTYARTQGGACLDAQVLCPPRRTAISGSVRVAIRRNTVRLSDLRYRTRGRAGCAPDVAEVRSAIADEPRLESIVVRDDQRRLRNPRIARVTVRASGGPSARLDGELSGDVATAARYTLRLTRR